MIDRRLNASRHDLADARLRGCVEAECFVEAQKAQVIVGRAALRPKPRLDVSIDTELLYGEDVDVFERQDGWAWVQAHLDGYVGYIEAKFLSSALNEITHNVSTLRTFIYPEPDLKSPPHHLVTMNAKLSVTNKEIGGFRKLTEDGWVFEKHITIDGSYDTDHCTVALRFLGTPYLWGGRTSVGLDCSALVQMSLMRCGQYVPRDSDMQENSIGLEVACGHELTELQRGDIVYWNGHCGIWINKDTFIHANATDMAVTVQPLKHILGHIAEATNDCSPRVRRPKQQSDYSDRRHF